ncbi:MAG: T9SS type A sorting domain-containing protein [Hyphomicrobiales bacterium]
MNVSGEVLYTAKVSAANQKVNLDLNAGIYFVKLINKDKAGIRKLVIQ